MSAIDARIAALSPEKRKALARLLASRGGTFNVFPLSSQQRRLWFMHQVAPDSPFYNVPLALRLSGTLDADALQAALGLLVERHEALRTSFHAVNGEPMQRVGAARLDWHVQAVSGADANQRRDAARVALEREVRRPFALEGGALLRALLLNVDADEHVLVLTLHHIVCDGWSLGVLLRELAQAYAARLAGRAPELPALALQYADYAAWQSQREREGVYDADLAFWRGQLAGAPAVLALPTDRERPETLQWSGAQLPLSLPAELVAALRALGNGEQATLFMVLLAAFHALLARWSGSPDVCVGTPAAQRPRTELEGLVGFFANTLVVRADTAGAPTVRTFIARVRTACVAAFAHQEAPLEQIVDALELRREANRHPLFQVAFALQSAPLEVQDWPGLRLRVDPIGTGTVQFDLVLNLQPAGAGLVGTLSYSTELFDAPRAARFVEHYGRLLEGFATRPDHALGELALDDREPQSWQAWGRAAAAAAGLPDGQELVLLDDAGRPQAVGLPGEVWVLDPEAHPPTRALDARPHPLRPDAWVRPAGWRAAWNDAGQLVPVGASLERRARARRLEQRALALPDVRDARAFDLDDAGASWGLALVMDDERLDVARHEALAALAASEPELLLLPLSRLPLDEAGDVDEAGLRGVARQARAAARLERRLRERPGVTEVALVHGTAAFETRALALSELLPGARWPGVAGTAGRHAHAD